MKTRIDGLYAITPDFTDTELLLSRASAALNGGARVMQYRNKKASAELRRVQAGALLALCRRSAATFIVNDHVELASAIDADGVHVGDGDAGIMHARSLLGGSKIIGASCYNRVELAHDAVAKGADYVAFGSFYPSSVKPGAVRATLGLLRQARRESAAPIVAIGGITLDNVAALINAGAHAAAVITALFNVNDVEQAARSFVARFAEART